MTLIISVAIVACAVSAQQRTNAELEKMLSAFRAERDIVQKESMMTRIASRFGETAGPGFLDAAKQAQDAETRWMAIRGIGYVKFRAAAPTLVEWLNSPEHYVRANAARALGEMRAEAAGPLIDLLKKETDSGVIEQTALALQMMHATEALAALEEKADHPSVQTRIWVIGAVEALGSWAELPFLAKYLYDANIQVAAQAARGIEQIAGQDFGFPQVNLFGLSDLQEAVVRARRWWEETQGR